MIKKVSSIILCLIFAIDAFADFQIINKDQLRIPFKMIGNLVVVPIELNGISLDFVLDSGVKSTMLFGENSQNIDLSNMQKTEIAGLGSGITTTALRSTKNRLIIGKNFVDTAHEIFLVFDEHFNFSANLGYEINGVVGYEFFKNHEVAINYDRKEIIVGKVRNKNRFETVLPISLEYGRPFVQVQVKNNAAIFNSKMLIDLGNTDAVWLFKERMPGFKLNNPYIEAFLGQGFSGSIYGKKMRIEAITIGGYSVAQPIAAIPDSAALTNLATTSKRSGSLGSDFMKRFNIIFDYPNQKIYLSKNKQFNKPFMINMSGMEFKHEGLVWEEGFVNVRIDPKDELQLHNKVQVKSGRTVQYKYMLKPIFIVSHISKNSAAESADIQVGDRLMGIESLSDTDLNINDIYALLSEKPGKKLRLILRRGNKDLIKHVILRDPIPMSH